MVEKNAYPTVKVFLSYAWDDPNTVDLVTRVAEELQEHHNVHPLFDQWDLNYGHELTQFMEQSVNNPEVKHVLMFCDKHYKRKADDRQRGVGYESTVISAEIAQAGSLQNKFIPIVVEKNQEGNAFIPTFLNGRMYVDLSEENTFNLELEKLARMIHGKPLKSRPTKTVTPYYLKEEPEHNFLGLESFLRELRREVNIPGKNLKVKWKDFVYQIKVALYSVKVEDELSEEEYLRHIIKKTNDAKQMRSQFIEAFDLFYGANSISAARLIFMFEEVYETLENSDDKNRYVFANDHIKFLIYEMFLLVTRELYRNEEWELLSQFLVNDFYPKFKLRNGKIEKFHFFRNPTNWTQFYNKYALHPEGLNLLNVDAFLLRERELESGTSSDFELMVDSDFLLYYISKYNSYFNRYEVWFPVLSAYRSIHTNPLKWSRLLYSKSRFEVVQNLFGFSNSTDAIEQISSGLKGDGSDGGIDYHIPPLRNQVDINKICSIP